VSHAHHPGSADGGQMTFWLGRLSPRRRMFAVGLAAVLAVVVAVVTVITIRATGGQGTQAASLPPQDRPGPVLLVPGYGGSTGSLSVLASRIRSTGRQATVMHLPGNGTGSLIADVSVLNAAVTSALRGGAPSVDVIGYSAGGVVTLLWERDDGGVYKARRVVTLGSPFHGAAIAAAGEAFVPGACPAACQQLVPGSSLLRQLDAATVPARPPWLSVWSTGDKTVTPPDSARLAGAINVPIQSVCPALQVSHSQLPTDPAVTAMVLGAIGPGPVRRPATPDCQE
jgi:triacylglycerol lipase